MKPTFKMLLLIALLPSLLLISCSDEKYVGLSVASVPKDPKPYLEQLPISKRHMNSPLKILAVGNSFTTCATYRLPEMVKHFNCDTVCIAKLVRSGATLSMHWTSHRNDTPDYEMYYSDDGAFVKSEICTIDDALAVMNWDIIVVQQASGLAGVYSTYQPALGFLLRLFRESNPDVQIAWQYTWAYMPGTVHVDFYRYGYDSERMYADVVAAGDRACAEERIEVPVRSAVLMHRLREEYPDVKDGFSTDGYHIDSPGLAGYALSALWYEALVSPLTATSCIDDPLYIDLQGMENKDIDKALAIVAEVNSAQ